jgi:hypothetical protein
LLQKKEALVGRAELGNIAPIRFRQVGRLGSVVLALG